MAWRIWSRFEFLGIQNAHHVRYLGHRPAPSTMRGDLRRWPLPGTEQPFRFMDLPVETRLQIYAQVALGSDATFPFPGLDGLPNSCLNISTEIAYEALPVVCATATVTTRIENWGFHAVRDMVAAFDELGMFTALRTNDNLVISIAATEWHEDFEKAIVQWLESGIRYFGRGWNYAFHQSDDERLKWKSRAGFLWRTGMQELRALRAGCGIDLWEVELDKMIQALEEESERVEEVLAREKSDDGMLAGWTQQHRLYQQTELSGGSGLCLAKLKVIMKTRSKK